MPRVCKTMQESGISHNGMENIHVYARKTSDELYMQYFFVIVYTLQIYVRLEYYRLSLR